MSGGSRAGGIFPVNPGEMTSSAIILVPVSASDPDRVWTLNPFFFFQILLRMTAPPVRCTATNSIVADRVCVCTACVCRCRGRPQTGADWRRRHSKPPGLRAVGKEAQSPAGSGAGDSVCAGTVALTDSMAFMSSEPNTRAFLANTSFM